MRQIVHIQNINLFKFKTVCHNLEHMFTMCVKKKIKTLMRFV